MTDDAALSYEMGRRKTQLLKLARRWRSELHFIREDEQVDEDSQWGPTSEELLNIISTEAIALDGRKGGEWENVGDDDSSEGEQSECMPEEDATLVEALEALEELAMGKDHHSDSREAFEICESEDESIIDSPSCKRPKNL